MNKYKIRFTCLTFLLSLALLILPTLSFAEDGSRKINITELEELLEKNKGKVVIVNLWATWCPPCRKEIPGFINLYNKYQKKGVEIIGIAFDENGEKVVPGFVKKTGINYPIYLSVTGIAEAYGLRAYPTTIIYGKNGKEVNKHIGFVSEREFDNEISRLLGE
ncbi:MAG: TlpA family protein disulfide reductase [Candidatus Loosdrechtia sp.]|uniref:TlpA family protein disulfide reductase n=1 Tax=Candidatus Loosdrechtia sp. TaxID=3101272 RepID=UPI003A615947|nr:MAG: TlpA disulfide reductase family protein [Candidatus Jettenia sp. AMX2]